MQNDFGGKYLYTNLKTIAYVVKLINFLVVVYLIAISMLIMGATCRVPQGSVLGALLPIKCINDNSYVNNLTKYLLFADDRNMYVFSKSRYAHTLPSH